MDWKDLYVVKFEEYFVASLHTISIARFLR